MRHARVALAFLVSLVAACGSPDNPGSSSNTWVGTITTEGNVTTVVNESGSVWGERARLVEELSIGVDAGTPEYTLGTILHVWDTGDRIVAVDRSVPAVRAYDGGGNYLGDVGREGQGPGEYQVPWSVGILPDGGILVTDTRGGGRVDVFNADLTYRTRWGPFPDQISAPGAQLQYDLTLSNDGTAYLRYHELIIADNDLRSGWRTIDADGLGPIMWQPRPEIEDVRNCLDASCSRSLSLPYRQQPIFAITPGGTIVGGVGDSYRFEMHHPDGKVTVVHQYGEPVPLSDDEWEYWTRRVRAQGLTRNAGWQDAWSGGVPRTKPAYDRFYPAQDGNLLVVREGPSRRIASCTEDPLAGDGDFVPCWEPTYTWDFFNPRGEYLGAIEPPNGHAGRPFINGARITLAVEDEAGVQRITRYRLVLPGEEQ